MPAHPELGENLQFILVGFVFVIIVLLILAGITQLVGLLFKQPAKPEKSAAKATPSTAASSPSKNEPAEVTEELDPALTAAIVAAAVHAVIGDQPHRILSIRPAQQSWAQEGRRQIFSSHTVR